MSRTLGNLATGWHSEQRGQGDVPAGSAPTGLHYDWRVSRTDDAGDHNVGALQELIAAQVPDREAVVDGSNRWTWTELTDRTRRLAAVLAGAGVGLREDPTSVAAWESPHDHVALYLYNGHEYVEGMLGAWKARAVGVNINYRYVAAELAYVLRDSAAKAVIVDDRFAGTLAKVLPELPDLRLILLVRSGEAGDDAAASLPPGTLDYEEALAGARPLAPSGLSPDDRYIVYTGGTTGMPKGVLWRQGDFVATCLGVTGTSDQLTSAARSERRAGLRTLPSAPLMHGAAHWNAFAVLAAGGTVVFPRDPSRVDPPDILATCERERVSTLQIVGDSFARPLLEELRRGRYDLSTLRSLISGGAVFSSGLKQEWTEALPDLRIVDVLGSSETGRQALGGSERASFSLEDSAAVLSSDRTRVLEPGAGETGWLAQRGRVPLGYLGDPDKTKATFPQIGDDRYAVAGDRVRLAEDGTMQFLGRDSAVINTGGEKVYAEEVEQALTAHPGVADALVVGRPSPRWGQEIVAVVMPAGSLGESGGPEGHPSDDELREHCRATLAGYKAPKAFFWVERVQRAPSGKPDYAWAKALVNGDAS